MADFPIGTASNQNLIAEDIIVPFAIENSVVHGRIIRLGGILNEIISNRNYPEPVAAILAELLTLTAMLGATLDSKAIFTIQLSGDGPVNFIITDCDIEGHVRGYANVDKEKYAELSSNDIGIDSLLGKGTMVITMDSGDKNIPPSQGIIALSGSTISECFTNYFHSSTQMDVDIKTFVTSTTSSESQKKLWSTGSIIIQRTPKAVITPVLSDEEKEKEDDAWQRARVFLASVTAKELLDISLSLHDVLYRLFHEDGVRVFEPKKIKGGCRCSREKIANMLDMMPKETIEEMKVDGVVKVTCKFCNTTEEFTDEDLQES